MKWWRIGIVFIVFCCGCTREEDGTKKVPSRILSTAAAATSILLQCDAPVYAIDEYGRIADEQGRLIVVGKGAAISLEQVVHLNIDGAVVWTHQVELADALRSHGIQVLELAPPRLSEISGMIRRLGMWSGRPKAAEARAKEFDARLEAVALEQEQALTPVYFELYTANKGAGDAAYIGDLLRAVGGKSILPKTASISSETIVAAAPEVIFYIEEFRNGDLALRPGIAATPAGRNGKIYPVPRRLLTEGIAPFEAIEYLQKKMR